MLAVAFSLLRPGFRWDELFSPDALVAPARIGQIASDLPADATLTLVARGETLEGDVVEQRASLPLGGTQPGEQRLAGAGLFLRRQRERFFVDTVTFASPADEAGIDLDWEILSVVVAAERPARQWFYPFLLLPLGLVARRQRRR